MNNDLKKYLKELLGKFEIQVSNEEKLIKVPLIYKNKYRFYAGTILQEDCIFFERRYYDDSDIFNEDSILKHIQMIEKKISGQLIFITDNITTKERQLLIKNRISFISPYKQAFLPFLFFESRSNNTRSENKEIINKFTPATQQILFYSLYKYILTFDEIINKKDIITKLGISNTTFNRAMNELINLKVMSKQGFTRNIVYSFLGSPQEIFSRMLEYCINPIKDTWIIALSYSNKDLINNQLKAGEYALSDLTMIQHNKVQFAINSNKVEENLRESRYDADYFLMHGEIQIWRYDAKPLIRYFYDDKVDPLSLYLSLYDGNRDERLSIELDSLLNQLFKRELFKEKYLNNIHSILEVEDFD